jgi:hypothetical protein
MADRARARQVASTLHVEDRARIARELLCAMCSGGVRAWVLAASLVGCTPASSRPNVPPFAGEESEWWLVQETEPVSRDDVLPAFEASAQNYGCVTEQLGLDSTTNIFGEVRSYYGVNASCDEGTIALITLVGGRVRIGCAKPMSRDACDHLLRNISQAR